MAWVLSEERAAGGNANESSEYSEEASERFSRTMTVGEEMRELLISDIQVAAFLVARGHKMLSIRPEGALGVFIFPADLQDEADKFFQDGQVSARKFGNAIRELKARVRFATQ